MCERTFSKELHQATIDPEEGVNVGYFEIRLIIKNVTLSQRRSSIFVMQFLMYREISDAKKPILVVSKYSYICNFILKVSTRHESFLYDTTVHIKLQSIRIF